MVSGKQPFLPPPRTHLVTGVFRVVIESRGDTQESLSFKNLY